MRKTVLGILAHVDAGKTTLSEAMLYETGTTKILGRVDKGNAYLDTYDMEKQRGITIFSKQAEFNRGEMRITLLDTPGHVDFSSEMERTLQVLDYAVLVVSASDGIQGHTKTLWELLKQNKVPVFVFVNKMDQPGAVKERLLSEIKSKLSDNCIDFTNDKSDEFYEEVASTKEELLEAFIENGNVNIEDIKYHINKRDIFPCYFGSALRIDGIGKFLDGLEKYVEEREYLTEFGAKIYKISRDEQGNRLTHLKITGGKLKARDIIDNSGEKVNQIRIYSGSKFQAVSEIEAGNICAVTGLTNTFSGQNLGIENGESTLVLEPVMTYRVLLPNGTDEAQMLPKLRMIEEEDPMLSVKWNEELKEIHINLMGEVQTEILKKIVLQRFNIEINFDHGNVVYKETIKNTVEGVGHFEPHNV